MITDPLSSGSSHAPNLHWFRPQTIWRALSYRAAYRRQRAVFETLTPEQLTDIGAQVLQSDMPRTKVFSWIWPDQKLQ